VTVDAGTVRPLVYPDHRSFRGVPFAATVDVYAPPAAASKHLPVMVWFYGGLWSTIRT
jgi:acetyl esterase/lipase